MALKGYQWLNDKGEVIMYYMFKDNIIYVNKDITNKQHREFYEFLKSKGFICNHTNFNNHTMTFVED